MLIVIVKTIPIVSLWLFLLWWLHLIWQTNNFSNSDQKASALHLWFGWKLCSIVKTFHAISLLATDLDSHNCGKICMFNMQSSCLLKNFLEWQRVLLNQNELTWKVKALDTHFAMSSWVCCSLCWVFVCNIHSSGWEKNYFLQNNLNTRELKGREHYWLERWGIFFALEVGHLLKMDWGRAAINWIGTSDCTFPSFVQKCSCRTQNESFSGKKSINCFVDWLPKQIEGGHRTHSSLEHCFSCFVLLRFVTWRWVNVLIEDGTEDIFS